MMKKLSRVKLINWHLFQNETIEIKGNLLISGDNGSGIYLQAAGRCCRPDRRCHRYRNDRVL